MTSKPLLAAVLAGLALPTAPAHAQRITENYQYQSATARGCTALFLQRQTSVSGVVARTWRMHANCGRELLAQMDGAAYTGQPSAACVGTPINWSGWPHFAQPDRPARTITRRSSALTGARGTCRCRIDRQSFPRT